MTGCSVSGHSPPDGELVLTTHERQQPPFATVGLQTSGFNAVVAWLRPASDSPQRYLARPCADGCPPTCRAGARGPRTSSHSRGRNRSIAQSIMETMNGPGSPTRPIQAEPRPTRSGGGGTLWPQFLAQDLAHGGFWQCLDEGDVARHLVRRQELAAMRFKLFGQQPG